VIVCRIQDGSVVGLYGTYAVVFLVPAPHQRLLDPQPARIVSCFLYGHEATSNLLLSFRSLEFVGFQTVLGGQNGGQADVVFASADLFVCPEFAEVPGTAGRRC
jgi:hypothetical protein